MPWAHKIGRLNAACSCDSVSSERQQQGPEATNFRRKLWSLFLCGFGRLISLQRLEAHTSRILCIPLTAPVKAVGPSEGPESVRTRKATRYNALLRENAARDLFPNAHRHSPYGG